MVGLCLGFQGHRKELETQGTNIASAHVCLWVCVCMGYWEGLLFYLVEVANDRH